MAAGVVGDQPVAVARRPREPFTTLRRVAERPCRSTSGAPRRRSSPESVTLPAPGSWRSTSNVRRLHGPTLVTQGVSRLRAKNRSMALRDTWHRTLVYFGLAEEEDPRHDAYDEPEPEAELEDRYRERPNVRRLQRSAAATRSTTSSPTSRARRRARHARPAPGRRQRPRRQRRGHPGPPRDPQELQRRPADRGPVQGRDPGDPQPSGHRHRPLEAPDRLRLRA